MAWRQSLGSGPPSLRGYADVGAPHIMGTHSPSVGADFVFRGQSLSCGARQCEFRKIRSGLISGVERGAVPTRVQQIMRYAGTFAGPSSKLGAGLPLSDPPCLQMDHCLRCWRWGSLARRGLRAAVWPKSASSGRHSDPFSEGGLTPIGGESWKRLFGITPAASRSGA